MPLPSADPSEEMLVALHAWNVMGKKLDLSVIGIVAEFVGADDIELLIRQLLAIRSHAERMKALMEQEHA